MTDLLNERLCGYLPRAVSGRRGPLTPGGAISASARETNAGWRIDYFIVSERLREKIGDALIYSDVYGSDHCPVGLVLDV